MLAGSLINDEWAQLTLRPIEDGVKMDQSFLPWITIILSALSAYLGIGFAISQIIERNIGRYASGNEDNAISGIMVGIIWPFVLTFIIFHWLTMKIANDGLEVFNTCVSIVTYVLLLSFLFKSDKQ